MDNNMVYAGFHAQAYGYMGEALTLTSKHFVCVAQPLQHYFLWS